MAFNQFAAEVFHGLYDEVMTASARGHGLVLRVQQLEAELPLLEKDVCQRDYLYIASNRGVDWHANLRVDHGVVTTGDTPCFIMDSIKQAMGLQDCSCLTSMISAARERA